MSVSDGNCAKATRPMEQTAQKMDKAMSVLKEAVKNVEQAFHPVLKCVPTCGDGKNLKGVGGDCDYETLMASLESRILDAAEELKQLCSRSAV